MRTLRPAAAVLVLVATIRSAQAAPKKTAPAPVAVTADAVRNEIRRPGASAVLVNVWATWCVPCREEFPDLLRAARELAPGGVRLILVSVDFPGSESEVRQFLSEQGVDFPTYLRKGKDEVFIDAMSPKWSGAIPATFVYDNNGVLAHSWEGISTYAVIKDRVLQALPAKEKR